MLPASRLGRCAVLLASLVLVCKFLLGSSGIADETENVRVCGCLIGWIRVHSTCYKVFDDKKSWDEAEQACQSFQNEGHLGYFQTKYELSLYHYMFGYSIEPSYWIGLSDKDNDGKWMWADNTELTEPNWAEGEPDNPGDELCGYLSFDEGFQKLRNGNCETPMSYVCRHPAIYHEDAWH